MDSSSSSDVKHYAWPSTVNFSSYVTCRPWLKDVDNDGSNFSVWKEQLLCLLESQDVVGFVNGDVEPPPDEHEHEHKLWRRTDCLVKGWILGSLGNDAVHAVWSLKTAKDVWVELDKLFRRKKAAGNVESSSYKFVLREDPSLSNVYLALYKAAQRGDWATAHSLFKDYNFEISVRISDKSETALHVAVHTGKANDFVRKMVELMPREALALEDSNGDTALHRAAVVGNTEAAVLMMDKNPDLLYIRNKGGRLAVLEAAVFCHKGILEYLLSKSKTNVEGSPFEGQLGRQLLRAVMASEFYDVALDMVYKYPNLATLKATDHNITALSALAQITSAFLSRESFTWWQRLIYYCIPAQKSKHEATLPTNVTSSDIENRGCNSQLYRNYFISFSFQIIPRGNDAEDEILVWNTIHDTVPLVRSIRNKKAMHQQTLQLVNYLCQQILTLPEKEASSILHDSMMIAAKNGISEIVEVIMEMYPKITFTGDKATGGTIFHLAAIHRFKNVFSLIYSLTDRKHVLYNTSDSHNNNLMHICGKLSPPDKLNLVPGAALQMQRELQWFKEMENFVHPSRRTWFNNKHQTPKMVFTNEHQQLKAEGERWMKDTANACTIAAALIATVMFTAAFTVPGGIDSDTGIPILVEQPAFILFAISDAVSLFTSITSLLMFLSILTSRYAEEDFLYVLPMRLSIGLLSLFISITFMLAAFSATMYLVFRGRVPWFLVPVAGFACLPVASFVLLQFPLLVDVAYSTYGPGIFHKKSDRVFY